jgi:Spy/CpxP family protein refolding chaperone
MQNPMMRQWMHQRFMRQGMMRQGFRGPGRMAMRAHVLRQLNLTEAQQGQLRVLREQQRKDMMAAREQLSAARRQLAEAMRADVPEEEAVRSAAGALATAQANQLAARARAKGQFMKLLTPEQQKQLKNAVPAGPRRQRQGWI